MSASQDDSMMRALSALPVIRPREEHAAQVRARARTILERRGRPTTPGFVEPATVSAVCAVYAWQILRIVLP